MENLAFKKYIGVKTMDATPMKRTDAENIIGHKITPSKKSNQDDGYLVKYEDEYLSWSPKDVFEKSYHEYKDESLDSIIIPIGSPDYRQRFISEYNQDESSFTDTCPCSVYDEQLLLMFRYSFGLRRHAKEESTNIDNR